MVGVLRILLLEDAAVDAELIARALQRSGLTCSVRIVNSEDEFRRELDEFDPDAILSDFTIPGFDGMAALRIARSQRPDTPFLFVSGTIGEERAVEALKQGANDYVMKDNLEKLPIALQRAREEHRLRAIARETDVALRASEARYRGILNSAMECIISIDERQRIVEFNPAAERLFGYSREQVLGRQLGFLLPEYFRSRHEEHIRRFAESDQTSCTMGPPGEISGLRADGEHFAIEATICQIGRSPDKLLTVILRDVTERRRDIALLRGHRERLQALTRHLMQVEESERRRLARELHDRIGQNITAMNLNLTLVQTELSREGHPKARARLDDCVELLIATSKLVRNVMADLRPPGLDELGVIAALNEHARQVSARTGLGISIKGPSGSLRLSPTMEITLFRIAQEAITNIVKHADATEVLLSLESKEESIILTVTDNGSGFDTAVRPVIRSLGIIGMRERAESIGAQFRVESTSLGTKVIVDVPRIPGRANNPVRPNDSELRSAAAGLGRN